MFGSYRRDEFADPDTFLIQLGMVLERYGDDVIGTVTHPYTGIQRRHKFPPSIAEVVEACESEAAAIDTRKRSAGITRLDRECRAIPISKMPAGHLATLLFRPTSPGYEAMIERARTSSPIYYRQDSDGIWVPFPWYDDWKSAGGSAQVRRFTMADLDAMIEQADAEAAPA